MWNTDTLWFEVTVVSVLFLLGNIFLGHFEERSPNWRKLAKYIATVIIIVSVSIFAGRVYALVLLGLFVIPVIYIHGIVLPKKGINGWTGEPNQNITNLGAGARISLITPRIKRILNSIFYS